MNYESLEFLADKLDNLSKRVEALEDMVVGIQEVITIKEIIDAAINSLDENDCCGMCNRNDMQCV